MRVLVCGEKGFHHRVIVCTYLDWFHKAVGIERIICGDASDVGKQYARDWAYSRRVSWERQIFARGTSLARRNANTLKADKPDLVLVFNSASKDLLNRARAAKIPVVVIEVTVRVRAPKKLQRFFA